MAHEEGKDTCEYRTLKKYESHISNAFSAQLVEISKALNKKEFIPQSVVKQMIVVSALSAQDKASQLMVLVEDKVELSVQYFYDLCEILTKYEGKRLSKLLKEHCQKIKGEQTGEFSFGDTHLPIQGAGPTDLDCPGSLFSVEAMKEMKRSTEFSIKHAFHIVKEKLIKRLESIGDPVNVDVITQYLADLIEREKVPKDKSSIRELINSLPSENLSFNNYYILLMLNHYLVDHKCSMESEIYEYEERYIGYRVSTKIIESNKFRQQDNKSKVPEDQSWDIEEICNTLKMKLPIEENVTQISLNFVDDVWRVISRKFSPIQLTAQIKMITDGCLEITWIIMPKVAKKISSTAETHEFFKSLNAITVVVDGDIIYERPDSAVRVDVCALAVKEKKEGDGYLKNKNYEQALECYIKAMVLDPFSAVMAASRAEALVQMKLYGHAEIYSGLSISLDDKYAKAYFIRARAKASLDKIEGALQDLKVTLKLEPNNMQAVHESERLESEIKRKEKLAEQDKGEDFSHESTDIPPSSTSIRCTRPGHQNRTGDQSQTWSKQIGECFERAISEKQKGDIHLQQGNCQKAVESYSQAMELDRFSADIATCKAEALFRQELYADAEETCSLALNLDDHCSKAYFIRARAKNKLGRLEESIEDFKFTLKLDPTNKEADTQLARLQGEFRRRTVKKYKRANKCDLPPLEFAEETCEVPHKPLPELEIVKVLDEWECKMSLRSLLGEEVLVSSNLSEKVPVDVFEQEGSVIGLFFSGIWCPASKVFTPELIDWYNRFKKGPKGNLLNIVFVSLDEHEESWREYSSGMPWYGVNFNDKARQSKLMEKYNVTGIPMLVFVEGKTGKINTTEGRSIVSKDPLGEGFPWKQKTFTEIMANGKLLDQSNEITWEQLKGKVVGLFFSRYDCIPAIEFTFKLVPLYENLKKAKKGFEVIYVSFDKDERDWQTYSKSMPWVSLPYDDERRVELRKLFDVQDIPTLILMDGEGGLISTEGCTCVESDPEGTNFPWYRYVDTLAKFSPRNTTDSETNMAQLIWFLPQHLMEKAKEILEPLAKEYISRKAETKMEIKLLFFIARDGDEASYDAKRFARLPQQTPLLTILDMEHNQVHISTSDEVTEENAKKFVYDFLQKRLFGRKLITK